MKKKIWFRTKIIKLTDLKPAILASDYLLVKIPYELKRFKEGEHVIVRIEEICDKQMQRY